MCGLHHQESFPDDVEVAWRLVHEHWGHGYATEAATAWLDHGFGPLGLPRGHLDHRRALAQPRRGTPPHLGPVGVADHDQTGLAGVEV
jgi:hypothetical protein